MRLNGLSAAAVSLLAVTAAASLPSSAESVRDKDQDTVKVSAVRVAPGKLLAPDGFTVMINGNVVRPGATVFPNSFIKTTDKGATVELGPLGKLDLAPQTTARLDFAPGSIKVNLEDGCVILTGYKGVLGEVFTKRNKVYRTDPSLDQSEVDLCYTEQAGIGSLCQGAAARRGAGFIILPSGTGISPLIYALGGSVAGGTAIIITSLDERPAPASSSTP